MDFFLAASPLLLLIMLMTVKKGMPSYYALPLVAVLLYLLQITYFREEHANIHASVLAGLLTAATLLAILWGAVFFFKTMEAVGSLSLIRTWLNKISPHPVAQLMLIGWAFSFFIEGISGFGTPAVMAAPLLVGLGFEPFRVVVFCLAMNTIPVSFGAVGTPMWFGFGELGLSQETLKEVSFKTTLLHSAAALLIPVMALGAVVPWKTLRHSGIFIYLSLAATLVPYVLFSRINTEFPSIIGGLSGLLATAWLARKNIGLSPLSSEMQSSGHGFTVKEYFRAFFPFTAAVALLIITRIKAFGLQQWLNTGSPLTSFTLPGLGEFHLSASLVLELRDILATGIDWKHPLLYVPSLIPFAAVALVCFVLFRIPAGQMAGAWSESLRRILKPLFALLGAMVFVKLFMLGGDRSPAALLGHGLAQTTGGAWNFAAVYLGALGAFFAGSCTLSNLTFGPIQSLAADKLGMDLPLALSLQSVGGAMGNMACIHNIVAVCAILGLQQQEGKILRKTFLWVIVYGLIAGTVSYLF